MDTGPDDSSVSDISLLLCIIIYHQLSVCHPLQLKNILSSVGETAPENVKNAFHCVRDVRKSFCSEFRDLDVAFSVGFPHSIDMDSFKDPPGNNKPVTYKQPD